MALTFRLMSHKEQIFAKKILHNVTIRWGWTESIISRRTAKLIQESEFIDLLREWVQDIFFPEEFFYATLATINRNELAKGKVVQGKSLN